MPRAHQSLKHHPEQALGGCLVQGDLLGGGGPAITRWPSGRRPYRDPQVLEPVVPDDEKFVHRPVVNTPQADIERYLHEALLAEANPTVLTSCEVTDLRERPADATANRTDRTVELALATPGGERILTTSWTTDVSAAQFPAEGATALELSTADRAPLGIEGGNVVVVRPERTMRTPGPEEETVETVWRGISEGLDAAAPPGPGAPGPCRPCRVAPATTS